MIDNLYPAINYNNVFYVLRRAFQLLCLDCFTFWSVDETHHWFNKNKRQNSHKSRYLIKGQSQISVFYVS